jgi:hypothetical protein
MRNDTGRVDKQLKTTDLLLEEMRHLNEKMLNSDTV